jgi:glycosyltransferase involved in cell wall biosynthesis
MLRQLRLNPIAQAGWREVRRVKIIREFVERSRGLRAPAQVDAEGGFYTPPLGLLPWFNPLSIQVSAALNDRPHLNVLLPGLATGNMSGGPNTALSIAYKLAALGVPVRFISTDTGLHGDGTGFWRHMKTLTDLDRLDCATLVDASDRGKMLEIGVNDIFMATAWWTAQMAKYAVRHTRHKRFVYLIQDYEPLLHAASTQSALAEETYGLDYIPVINSTLLADYFFTENVGRFSDPAFREQALVFEPAVDRTRFYPAPLKTLSRKRRRLLFYARPTKGLRNLFELGVAALQKLISDGSLDPAEWEFTGMGEAFTPIPLGKGAALKAEPWRDLDGYAALMRESDVLLSLMLSPHPSYPPLEMAACGRPVVTSVYRNKTARRLRQMSAHIIGVEPTVEAIADGLLEAVASDQSRIGGVLNLPATWSESLSSIVPGLYEALLALHGAPRLTETVSVGGRPLAGALFPGYRSWPVDAASVHKLTALRRRQGAFAAADPHLVGFITAVCNTEPALLAELAEAVFGQDSGPGFEWVILDNASRRDDTRAVLNEIARNPAVKLFRVEEDLGDIGAHRYLLERAQHRYVIPLGQDDLISPDCVRVVTTALRQAGLPPIACSDEDNIGGDPCIEPDWDPVLFVHSCHTSHLCVFDRVTALRPGCCGPVRDTVMRFCLAGHVPLHIPEIIHTRRMHAGSTVPDTRISASQRKILESFAADRAPGGVKVELSPLFDGRPAWRFVAVAPVDLSRLVTFELDDGGVRETLSRQVAALGPSVDLVHLVQKGATVVCPDWAMEAITLMKMFPDTDIVGGRIHDGKVILEAGFVFGCGGSIGCPDARRALTDCGYFAQSLKPCSVGAVSARHCVVRRSRLMQAMDFLPSGCGIGELGLWLGASARAAGRRVIYTPFLELCTSQAISEPAAETVRALTMQFGHLQGAHCRSDRSAAAALRPDYRTYLTAQLASRMREAPRPSIDCSFTIVTPCYIKTNAELLRATAAVVRAQTWPNLEWLILAQGPVDPDLSLLLDNLAEQNNVRVLRQETNLGILGGLALCLAQATGDFILPLDADDLLTPDAITRFAAAIAETPDAEILYSDEDMLIDGQPRAPYYRPDLDPVLLLTHSYVWHAIAYRRSTAIALGLYRSPEAEFAQDWDTMLRFYRAGHRAIHVPEVLYHWRHHSASVSHSGRAFDGSRLSVEAILRKIAAETGRPELYEVTTDPFLPGGSDSRLRRVQIEPPSGAKLLLGASDRRPETDGPKDPLEDAWEAACYPNIGDSPARFADHVANLKGEFVLLLGPHIDLKDWSGVWDAIKHLELVPSVMAVGGVITDRTDRILFGAPVLLPDGRLHDPLAGKQRLEPGPFSLALKPHCVGALCIDMVLSRRSFLSDALAAMPRYMPLSSLGVWLGSYAEGLGCRVAYDPSWHVSVRHPEQLIPNLNHARDWDQPAGGAKPPPLRGLSAFVWHSQFHT